MHLRLRKCEKSPQTYRKLADLRLRNTSCSFAEFAVAELSLNLRCPALLIELTLSFPTKTICIENYSTWALPYISTDRQLGLLRSLLTKIKPMQHSLTPPPPKDPHANEKKTCSIYFVPCCNCDHVYIGKPKKVFNLVWLNTSELSDIKDESNITVGVLSK